MQIRKAKQEDVESIMEMIRMAQQSLCLQKIDQWQDGYPNQEVIMEDIRKRESYVAEINGNAAGTAVISLAKEHTYDQISHGKWITENDENYVVIHRIATHNDWKRRGVAGELLKYAEITAKESGKKSVRIDTHPDNWIMQTWLEKNGFSFCGWIYLESRALRYAYEKVL